MAVRSSRARTPKGKHRHARLAIRSAAEGQVQRLSPLAGRCPFCAPASTLKSSARYSDRNEPLTYAGQYYQIPYAGPGATELGKPLKSIMHGNPRMKIYMATIAPASIRNSAEVADGMFPIFMNPKRFDPGFEIARM
jgi:hypothetical protein